MKRTIAEVEKQFIDTYRTQKKTSTAKMYAHSLRVFHDYLTPLGILPEHSPDKITVDLFVDFIGWTSERFTEKTLRVYVAGVKKFIDKLVVEDYLLPDYRDTIRIKEAMSGAMKASGKTLPKVPSDTVIQKMLEAAGQTSEPAPRKERDTAVILFLYSTGCRVAEVAPLKVKDVDFTERRVLVLGKGQKERWVFFNGETEKAIKGYWKARGWSSPDDPLFARHDRGARGKKHKHLTTTTLRSIVDLVETLAGVEGVTPHKFRHAFATRMLNETGDLALVQDMLGHSDPRTTRVYAKVNPKRMQEMYHEVFGK